MTNQVPSPTLIFNNFADNYRSMTVGCGVYPRPFVGQTIESGTPNVIRDGVNPVIRDGVNPVIRDGINPSPTKTEIHNL